MISFERFSTILDELSAKIPEEIYKNLNLGVNVSDIIKKDHRAPDNLSLYILGEYRVHPVMGRGIVLYYGSFCEVFPYLRTEDEWKAEINKVLKHELTHHLESQAGNRDLEFDDTKRLMRFRTEDTDREL